MIGNEEMTNVVGRTAYSIDGEKIGTVGQLYLDDTTNQPEFVTVNTGLLGMSESFVPVVNASVDGDRLVVPFSKDKVKDAPSVEASDQHLDSDEERRLFDYYGMDYGTPSGLGNAGMETGGMDTGGMDTGQVADVQATGHDTSGPNTDDAMTRSEEQLTVGTTSQEAGRARLRKYVTVEEETHTIPVRKERAVLEREPITEANVGAATAGPEISEEEHEVILHEEKPVVQKTTEPVERVRLGTETTTEEAVVTGEVRKEHIEADGDLDK